MQDTAAASCAPPGKRWRSASVVIHEGTAVSPLATVDVEHVDGAAIVSIGGEIDVSNGDEVQSAVLDAVTLETRCLLLDLSGVEYFDSVGVRLSFELEQRLARQRIEFAIVRPPASYVRKVLELCGAEHVLATYDDRDAALDNR
jgi:anti-sigma B factor antagonist